jgi:hypothetical protein
LRSKYMSNVSFPGIMPKGQKILSLGSSSIAEEMIELWQLSHGRWRDDQPQRMSFCILECHERECGGVSWQGLECPSYLFVVSSSLGNQAALDFLVIFLLLIICVLEFLLKKDLIFSFHHSLISFCEFKVSRWSEKDSDDDCDIKERRRRWGRRW